MMLKKGLVQIYSGEGKGKTTAAFGLALRAAGNGFKVAIFQFLKAKGNKTGELALAKKFKNVKILRNDQTHPIFKKSIKMDDLRHNAEMLCAEAKTAVLSGKYDMVVMDEINNCMCGRLIEVEEVLSIIKQKPMHVELVLTGRSVPEEIVKAADLVTEMKMVKHPYEKGISARKGIEY